MTSKHLGRYEIIETLGRGSMGVVYKAHDPLIERTVAIKTVSYAGLTPAEGRDVEERFFFEAKSAGRLSHPNIVTIHDVGHAEDLAYIAMEFLPGHSLREVLDSGVVLSTRQIAKIAHHVASGLAYAHSHGVIHRDIKPANIMVPESGQVKITDFGIALLPSGSLTMAGTTVGSPKYMSPEQVLGHKADRRSDIFSLGAVLYEMLTGRPPFAGDDLNAILYQVLNGIPPLPSDLNASLPPAFDRIIARALAKDPDKRYQHAEEMASDLRHYKKLPGLMHVGHTNHGDHGEPENFESPSIAPEPTPTVVRPATKNGLWLGGLMAAFAVFCLGAYFWLKSTPVVDAAPVAATTSAAPVRVAAARTQTSAPPAVATPATAEIPTKDAVQEKRVVEPKPPKPARKDSKKVAEAPAPQPAPAVETPKPVVADWKTKLYADMAACESLSFFSRIACQEKARWKHCEGHWGSIDICSQANSN